MGAMSALGDLHRRSANAEITAAIVESLGDRKRASAIRRSFVRQLGLIESAVVLSKVAVFAVEVHTPERRDAIRLPDGVRASVTEAADLASAESGVLITMNDWILDAVLWWINNQRECTALLDAIVAKDDVQEGHCSGDTLPG